MAVIYLDEVDDRETDLSQKKVAMLRLLAAEQGFEVGLAELTDPDFIGLCDAALAYVARISGGTYLAQITPAGRAAIQS